MAFALLTSKEQVLRQRKEVRALKREEHEVSVLLDKALGLNVCYFSISSLYVTNILIQVEDSNYESSGDEKEEAIHSPGSNRKERENETSEENEASDRNSKKTKARKGEDLVEEEILEDVTDFLDTESIEEDIEELQEIQEAIESGGDTVIEEEEGAEDSSKGGNSLRSSLRSEQTKVEEEREATENTSDREGTDESEKYDTSIDSIRQGDVSSGSELMQELATELTRKREEAKKLALQLREEKQRTKKQKAEAIRQEILSMDSMISQLKDKIQNTKVQDGGKQRKEEGEKRKVPATPPLSSPSPNIPNRFTSPSLSPLSSPSPSPSLSISKTANSEKKEKYDIESLDEKWDEDLKRTTSTIEEELELKDKEEVEEESEVEEEKEVEVEKKSEEALTEVDTRENTGEIDTQDGELTARTEDYSDSFLSLELVEDEKASDREYEKKKDVPKQIVENKKDSRQTVGSASENSIDKDATTVQEEYEKLMEEKVREENNIEVIEEEEVPEEKEAKRKEDTEDEESMYATEFESLQGTESMQDVESSIATESLVDSKDFESTQSFRTGDFGDTQRDSLQTTRVIEEEEKVHEQEPVTEQAANTPNREETKEEVKQEKEQAIPTPEQKVNEVTEIEIEKELELEGLEEQIAELEEELEEADIPEIGTKNSDEVRRKKR